MTTQPVGVQQLIVLGEGFELDLRPRRLRHGSRVLKLERIPLEILFLLVERPGEIVTREEIVARVWGNDVFLDTDNSIRGAVRKVRYALKDDAETPRFIQTATGRGYRFIAPVVFLKEGHTAVSPRPEASSASISMQNLVSGPEEPDSGLQEGIRRQVLEHDAVRLHSIETLSLRGSSFLAEAVPEVAAPEVAVPDPTEPAIAQPGSPQTPKARKHVLVVGAAAAIVLLGALGLLLQQNRHRPHTTAPQIHSIAVLPLENLSRDPEQEYFADGMTDALITDLAQISSLKVISRTSTVRYKGTHKSLPDIAMELNVDGIVEGTVIRTPERLRVDAQLIEANSDRHFWARSYERKPGDAVALQNELAQAIANEIQAKLTPREQARLQRTESVDPQTYELYLRGRYFFANRRDVPKSIDYFQQAIQRNPQYAAAYAAMAEAYVAIHDDLSPEIAFSKAKAAARAALQMDDTLAEAHSALAMSLFMYDWDWAGAEKEFQRAIVLNPNYAQAHQWYAQYLRTMGRQDLAVEELKRAEELEPLSLVIAGGSGRYGKQYDLMLENARKKLELYPNDPRSYLGLGRVYRLKGMYPEAIGAYQKSRDLSGGDTIGALTGLGYTYAVWGKRAEALKTLEELKAQSKRRYVSPYSIATVYAGLGEKDLAFYWLQKSVTEHNIFLPGLKTGEEWASLRSDQRYRELLNRIGLPQ
jgi:TolB-like protein/DNA-binding winged helix-turn-helix (wHTH) protein/Tfp pilus assembly protein PilF